MAEEVGRGHPGGAGWRILLAPPLWAIAPEATVRLTGTRKKKATSDDLPVELRLPPNDGIGKSGLAGSVGGVGDGGSQHALSTSLKTPQEVYPSQNIPVA